MLSKAECLQVEREQDCTCPIPMHAMRFTVVRRNCPIHGEAATAATIVKSLCRGCGWTRRRKLASGYKPCPRCGSVAMGYRVCFA